MCFVAIKTDCVACTHSINAPEISPIKILQAANFNKLRAECWCFRSVDSIKSKFPTKLLSNYKKPSSSHWSMEERKGGECVNRIHLLWNLTAWLCGSASLSLMSAFPFYSLHIFFVPRRQVVVFLWQKHFRPKYEQKDEPKRRQWNLHHVLKFSPYMQLQC